MVNVLIELDDGDIDEVADVIGCDRCSILIGICIERSGKRVGMLSLPKAKGGIPGRR
jgi:hypothetical protein